MDKERPHIEDRDVWLIERVLRRGELNRLMSDLDELSFVRAVEHEEGPYGPVSSAGTECLMAFLQDHHWAALRLAGVVQAVAWLIDGCSLPYWRCLQVNVLGPGMYVADHCDAGVPGYEHRMWTAVCEVQDADGGGLIVGGRPVHMREGDVAVFRSSQRYSVDRPDDGVGVQVKLALSSARPYVVD